MALVIAKKKAMPVFGKQATIAALKKNQAKTTPALPSVVKDNQKNAVIADKALGTNLAGLKITMTVPFTKETQAYVGVTINGVERWLAKTSIISYKINGKEVRVTMLKSYAKRRGIT